MPLDSHELKLLQDVVSLPTAPFLESRVQDFIMEWAAAEGIGLDQDRAGNLLLSCGSRNTRRPWVLQAHMDHPGFVYIDRRGCRARAWFRGGVRREYFAGARMRFIAEDGTFVRGTVRSVRSDRDSGFLRCSIELDSVVDLPEGTLGMWDLPPWRRRRDVLSLRAADDLCGVAAVLLALRRLKRAGCRRWVLGLLTRAEEVGFVGALSASKNKLVDSSWPVLGIEASREQPNARLGSGAVIRVGDAMSVFNPGLTAVLRQTARDLEARKQTAHLRYVASLMPGGSTESTGLALMGHETCAVCLPLGNYHNMGRNRIAPEMINLRDFEALAALLTETVQRDPGNAGGNAMKKRLLENHRKRAPLL